MDTILTVTDRLFSSVGDAHEMVRQARQLAQVRLRLDEALVKLIGHLMDKYLFVILFLRIFWHLTFDIVSSMIF